MSNLKSMAEIADIAPARTSAAFLVSIENALSSVVMYDTATKKRKGKLYKVERIIDRRKTFKVSRSCTFISAFHFDNQI